MAGDASFAYFNSEYRNSGQCIVATGNTDNVDINGTVACSTSFEEEPSNFVCGISVNGVCAPILDYEIVERKHTFTVYKIHVVTRTRNWFIFRRYSDFVMLNKKLRRVFPCFRVCLPRKKYFGNNYDPKFLSERKKGLQLFLNTLLQHELVSQSELVEEFLCLSDPPGPYDSLEESRAFCHELEAVVHRMKNRLRELESELSATRSSLIAARITQEALSERLKEERAKNYKLVNLKNDLERRLSVPQLTEVTHEAQKLFVCNEPTDSENIGRCCTR